LLNPSYLRISARPLHWHERERVAECPAYRNEIRRSPEFEEAVPLIAGRDVRLCSSPGCHSSSSDRVQIRRQWSKPDDLQDQSMSCADDESYSSRGGGTARPGGLECGIPGSLNIHRADLAVLARSPRVFSTG